MAGEILKQVRKNDKRENKILSKEKEPSKFKQKIYSTLPDKVVVTLEKVFEQAFKAIFITGSGVVEKTFSKEDLQLEFQAVDFMVSRKPSRKMLKKMDKPIKKAHVINSSVTTASGVGMGVLGWGLPDIPVFVGVVLNGVYQTAISYGCDYSNTKEQIYILRLIAVALLDGEDKIEANIRLEQDEFDCADIENEISIASRCMAKALLVEKFVQGIPIVGVVGGFTNLLTYKKISKLAVVKYRKRYLVSKVNINKKIDRGEDESTGDFQGQTG